MTAQKTPSGMMKQETHAKNGLVGHVSNHLFGMFKSTHDASHSSKAKSNNENSVSSTKKALPKETNEVPALNEKQSNTGKATSRAGKGKRLEELRKLMILSPMHPPAPKPTMNSISNSPLESPKDTNGVSISTISTRNNEFICQESDHRNKENMNENSSESFPVHSNDSLSNGQENSESPSNSDSETKDSSNHSSVDSRFREMLTLDDFVLEKQKKTDALLADVIQQLGCPVPNLRKSSSFSSLVLPCEDAKSSENEECASVHPFEDKPMDKSPFLSPFCKSPANPLSTANANGSSEEFEFRPSESKSQPYSPASSSVDSSLESGESEIKDLLRIFEQGNTSAKRKATESMRNLSKVSSDTRAQIGENGGIFYLVKLLAEEDPMTVEHAVTALLNLALDPKLKKDIVSLGAIDPLVRILSSENSTQKARENAAGAVCTLSVARENRALIRSSGAIPLLIRMLGQGSTRGKKDAAIGLFNLSIESEGRFEIVDAGAIQSLVEMLSDGEIEIEDDIIALLTSLTRSPYACKLMEEEGAVSVLVGVLDGGSPRGKFNAVVALLNLANSEEAKQSMWEEGAIPVLVGYAQESFVRGKEQAVALLKTLRESHTQ